MASTAAFERAFPRRELTRGSARIALLWSVIAALILCCLLIVGGFFLDLLVTRGRVALIESDRDTVERLGGSVLAAPFSTVESAVEPEHRVVLTNTGVFPTIWKLRNTPLAGPLGLLYRRTVLLKSTQSALMTLLGTAALLGLLRSICLSRAAIRSETVGHDIASSLRRMIHRQALRLGPGDLRELNGSQALRLFLDDVEIVRNAVALTVKRLSRHPIELGLLALLALACHWRMTLLCVLPLVGGWWLVHRIRRRAERTVALEKSKADTELRRLAESFRTTRLVRGFSMENWDHEQFQKHLERFRQNEVRVAGGQRAARWGSRLIVIVSLTLVAFLLGSKVLQAPDDLSFAMAGFLCLTIAAMYRPLEQLRQVTPLQEEASLAADRIFRYIDQIPDVSQAVGAKFLNPLSKMLRFDGVSFSLSRGRKLLERLDLTIKAGEKVALASFDPLETRALAHLLPRFIDPQGGRILIDGEDTALATLESLRAEAVYVSGDDPCFTGTVIENITCGGQFTLPDATAAAKTAHAHNFIQKLPQGYETVLGEHGEQLDPGQAYRLGLARAILRNPALLILEEPGDTLDDDTKALLEDAYHRITKGRTVIFLPSRLSTVRRADRVVFLHKGKVEAAGTQSDLLRTCPLYRHWEYVNFNEFRGELEPVEATA